MELNWITITAQLVNLFVLVYLLRRYLFGPITAVMREREERIRRGLAEGRDMLAQGEEMSQTYRQRLHQLDQEKQAILEQARADAEARRQELLEVARREADTAHRHLHASLEEEKSIIQAQLQVEIIDHVIGLTSQVLKELADTTLEEQAARLLVQRLESAEADQLALLKGGLAQDPRLVITTGQPLTPERQASLTDSLNRICAPHRPEIQFRVWEELGFGAALQTQAASLTWNAADYLRQLAAAAQEGLGEGASSSGDEHV